MTQKPTQEICYRCNAQYATRGYKYPLLEQNKVALICVSCYNILKSQASTIEEEGALVSKYAKEVKR